MTLADLILHDATRRNLELYLKKPTHALLLAGPNGVGLGTIAETLGRELAGNEIIKISPQPHKTQTRASINIDDVRQLRDLTRDRRRDNLAIVLDEAETMTRDTPQALLKLLEEPAAHVFYILTSHLPERLPATIKSRAQTIEVLPPPDNLQNWPNEPKMTTARRAQIQFLAARRPAELRRLLADETYFRTKAAAMETAKSFLQGGKAARLKIITQTDGRDAALALANDVAQLLMLTATRVGGAETAAANLQLAAAVLDNLAANGNVRLQLLYLATNLA